MINLELTEEELNIILHGLYLLEDQSWFFGKDISDRLINKLNRLDKDFSIKKEAVCDI